MAVFVICHGAWSAGWAWNKLPARAARPATRITVTAAMVEMPQSMASLTKWKIGPAWVRQQAKSVKAMALNAGVRTACPTVMQPMRFQRVQPALPPPSEFGQPGPRIAVGT